MLESLDTEKLVAVFILYFCLPPIRKQEGHYSSWC